MHDKSRYQRGEKNQVSPGIEIANHPDLNLICILMISLHANPRLSGCLATRRWREGGRGGCNYDVIIFWEFFGSLKAATG